MRHYSEHPQSSQKGVHFQKTSPSKGAPTVVVRIRTGPRTGLKEPQTRGRRVRTDCVRERPLVRLIMLELFFESNRYGMFWRPTADLVGVVQPVRKKNAEFLCWTVHASEASFTGARTL